MTRYALTSRAEVDLTDIVEFIALDSPREARKVLRDLHDAMDHLAELPMIGHSRPGLQQDLRVWPVHSYLIAYRPTPEPLLVLRVLSGFRDLERLLG